MTSETSRFLIKLRDSAAPSAPRISARLGMAGTEVTFASEPLFQSVGVRRDRGIVGGASCEKPDDGGLKAESLVLSPLSGYAVGVMYGRR